MNKSLVDLSPGEIGTVVAIGGCGGSCKRLRELGFTIGTEVRVVKNDKGPIIVTLMGSKIALGRNISSVVILNVD